MWTHYVTATGPIAWRLTIETRQYPTARRPGGSSDTPGRDGSVVERLGPEAVLARRSARG